MSVGKSITAVLYLLQISEGISYQPEQEREFQTRDNLKMDNLDSCELSRIVQENHFCNLDF